MVSNRLAGYVLASALGVSVQVVTLAIVQADELCCGASSDCTTCSGCVAISGDPYQFVDRGVNCMMLCGNGHPTQACNIASRECARVSGPIVYTPDTSKGENGCQGAFYTTAVTMTRNGDHCGDADACD